MYDTVLHPTDGSTGANVALENVRNLAETYGSTVHVLYVTNTSHEGFGLGTDPKEHSSGMVGDPEGGDGGMVGERMEADEMRAQLEEHGQSVVDETASRLDDIETETVVRSGDPHEVILDYADDADADVIVMGTHGRTGLDRYLIGSVTEKVVRLSDVPVLTVRERDESDA